jgi:plasmid stabilization system protein ParE
LSRFLLSIDAEFDLDEILAYLDEIPQDPGDRIAQSIQTMLESIGSQPYLGTQQSHLTRLLGEEVYSRLAYPYRIYYRLVKSIPEVFAILHGARDQRSILDSRFK